MSSFKKLSFVLHIVLVENFASPWVLYLKFSHSHVLLPIIRFISKSSMTCLRLRREYHDRLFSLCVLHVRTWFPGLTLFTTIICMWLIEFEIVGIVIGERNLRECLLFELGHEEVWPSHDLLFWSWGGLHSNTRQGSSHVFSELLNVLDKGFTKLTLIFLNACA